MSKSAIKNIEEFEIIFEITGSRNQVHLGESAGEKYILKAVDINPKGAAERGMLRDFISDVISADLYSKALQEQVAAANVIARSDDGKAYSAIKYIDGFKSLAELTGGPDDTRANPDSEVLITATGLEKIVAAAIFNADADIHAGNLAINDGKIIKIDNGKSGSSSFGYPQDSFEQLSEIFKDVGLDGVKFDITKFRDSCNTLSKISDKEIEESIASKIEVLKDLGIKPSSMNPMGEKTYSEMAGFKKPKPASRLRRSTEPAADKTPEELQEIEEKSFNAMQKFFTNKYLNQKTVLSSIVDEIDKTLSLEGLSKEFTEGKWLNKIAKKGADGILKEHSESSIDYRVRSESTASELSTTSSNSASSMRDRFESYSPKISPGIRSASNTKDSEISK
jgi:hypothetical protein